MRVAVLFSMVACTWSAEAVAQAPIRLGPPDARSAEPFTLLRGAQELPDGRLLVTDWTEQRVAVVDLARGTVEDRGRVGAGPGEFRLPASLLPFRGDSILLVDLGNGRLTVIDAVGRIGRSFQPANASAGQPGGADARGRLYFTIPAWRVERPLPDDTVELAVYDIDTQQTRVLARVHGSRRPSSNYAPNPRVPFVVFAAQDTWSVGADGRIAIVRDAGYRVQWLDGERTATGPAITSRPQPVTPADRSAFVRQFLQSSPTSGRGPDGGLGHTPVEMLTNEKVEGMVRASEFAETLPAFRAGDTRIDAAGRLWVGIWVRAGEARRYDVFDGRGHRLGTVQLAAERHLLTVGRAHVYIVHTDGDGLQVVERHGIPASLAGPSRS